MERAGEHCVVIVGGGFGGLYVARELGKAPAEVVVIDRRNFHLFQPLLYQVATGGLSPGDISSPIRNVLKKQKNTYVYLAEVAAIDKDRRLLRTSDGETISYDTLVLATGSSHDYFGHPEWSERAPGLKTIEDAIDIRSRIFLAFESAERETDPERRKALLTFVVVGGGPTGVEMAGALGEIATATLASDFRHINPADAQILLVEGGSQILAAYPADLAARAEKSLRDLGVTIYKKHLVTSVDDDGVDIKNDAGSMRVDARTVLWCAGVRSSSLGKMVVDDARLLDRAGRVAVEKDFSVPGHPDIFVIGDLASYPHQNGTPLPGLAPVAQQAGHYVGKLLARRLSGKAEPKPFHYVDYGVMATIGRASAIGIFGGKVKVWGLLGWLSWLFIHVMKLVEFENRVLVLWQWFWSYATRNRGARLITGEKRLPFWREERARQEQEKIRART